MERHARSREILLVATPADTRVFGFGGFFRCSGRIATGKVVCSQVFVNFFKCKISQHVHLITDCTLTRTALDSVQVLLSVKVSARL